MTLKPVTSLLDLWNKAKSDKAYEKLAIDAAINLGFSPKDLKQAMQCLEQSACDGITERDIIEEVNNLL